MILSETDMLCPLGSGFLIQKNNMAKFPRVFQVTASIPQLWV